MTLEEILRRARRERWSVGGAPPNGDEGNPPGIALVDQYIRAAWDAAYEAGKRDGYQAGRSDEAADRAGIP